MSNREQFDWDHRIKYLLKESFEPKTFQHYKRAVGRGLNNARTFLQSTEELVPSVDTVRTIHQYGFGSVYGEAGDFRAFGQEIAIGRDDARGAYYSQIPKELSLLSKQTSELFREASTDQLKARAVTFYHLRYVKTHPFLDGNGRTGRVIFDYQTRTLLGTDRRIDFSYEEYIEGIQRAFSTGDVSALAKTMTGVELSPDLAITPFPLKLGEIVVTKEISGGVNLKVPCGEDVETAQEVEGAILSPRLVKAVMRGEKVAIELFESTSRRNALIDIDVSKYKKIDLGKGLEIG